jgi:UDP-N-acetylglucosamine:LPS N-acetylglucosamine transferase
VAYENFENIHICMCSKCFQILYNFGTFIFILRNILTSIVLNVFGFVSFPAVFKIRTFQLQRILCSFGIANSLKLDIFL